MSERVLSPSIHSLSLSLPFLFRGRISSLPVPSSLLGVTLALKWIWVTPFFRGPTRRPLVIALHIFFSALGEFICHGAYANFSDDINFRLRMSEKFKSSFKFRPTLSSLLRKQFRQRRVLSRRRKPALLPRQNRVSHQD